jgi:hypothetical protein
MFRDGQAAIGRLSPYVAPDSPYRRGARPADGRWSRPGTAAEYAAENRERAVLEAMLHTSPRRTARRWPGRSPARSSCDPSRDVVGSRLRVARLDYGDCPVSGIAEALGESPLFNGGDFPQTDATAARTDPPSQPR